jgi:hypothetical protein
VPAGFGGAKYLQKKSFRRGNIETPWGLFFEKTRRDLRKCTCKGFWA